MRRQSIAFVLVDAAFLADPKFRALARRLPNADDFNSTVGAWLIALADARRSGDPTIDVATVTGSRFASDLLAVGLINDRGFPPKSFADWAPMSPQQANAGRARAEQADGAGLRDDKGRFLPSPASSSEPSALDSLAPLDRRGPAFPSPPIQSTQPNDDEVSPLDGAGGAQPEADAITWLAKHGCYLRPSSGYYRHIVLAVEHHGIDGVIGMLDRLAAAGTAQGDVRGYIFGASDALDARTRPRLADLAKAEREAEIENASQRELQRTTRIIEELTSVEVPNKPLDALVGPMPWRTGR